jgi:hypothetical protein
MPFPLVGLLYTQTLRTLTKKQSLSVGLTFRGFGFGGIFSHNVLSSIIYRKVVNNRFSVVYLYLFQQSATGDPGPTTPVSKYHLCLRTRWIAF